AGTGRFFAYKLRSAVLWSLYERTSDPAALQEAVKAYRTARQAWASMAEMAKSVYAADITYGPNANLRGHWFDRIPGIDGDLGDMEKRLAEAKPATNSGATASAIKTVLSRPHRLNVACNHTPATKFEPGKILELSVSFQQPGQRKVNLLYRQADQSQRWRSQEMEARDREHRGAIPADYTESP